MIFVTTQAREELSRLLDQQEHQESDSFRLRNLGDRGLGLDISERKSHDKSLEFKGKTVLVFDPSMESNREGISLDAYDTPDGPRFVISKEVTRGSHSSVTVNWVNFSRQAAAD